MIEPGMEQGMETEASVPRQLSCHEAAQAACFLFELNTRERDVLEMAERAGLAPGTPLFCKEGPAAAQVESLGLSLIAGVDKAVLLREWYAFVHAAVVYGLMAEAPNAVVTEYLRATRDLLGKLAGYDTPTIDAFVDGAFGANLRLMAQGHQKDCPARFYQQVLACEDLSKLAPERVAFLSGMMAITMCAILDKLAQYTYSVD